MNGSRADENVFETDAVIVALVSIRIQDAEEPVRAVWHHANGDWVMWCETVDVLDPDAWVTVHVQHLVDRDRTLRAVGDLPEGWAAFREWRGMAWVREPIVDDA